MVFWGALRTAPHGSAPSPAPRETGGERVVIVCVLPIQRNPGQPHQVFQTRSIVGSTLCPSSLSHGAAMGWPLPVSRRRGLDSSGGGEGRGEGEGVSRWEGTHVGTDVKWRVTQRRGCLYRRQLALSSSVGDKSRGDLVFRSRPLLLLCSTGGLGDSRPAARCRRDVER